MVISKIRPAPVSVCKLLDLEIDTMLFGGGASILHDAKLRSKELVDTFPGV